MRRQSSRTAAFLQADAGPMFCWWLIFWQRYYQCCDLEIMVSRLECTRVHFGLWSWSRDLKTQVSVLVSRQHAWCLYACSTITVISSTYKRVLCHQLMQPVLWSRDHGLETRVHSSWLCPGIGLSLETWRPRSRSWSRDLMAKVLVSRPKKVLTTTLLPVRDFTRIVTHFSWTCVDPGLGLGCCSWLRSRMVCDVVLSTCRCWYMHSMRVFVHLHSLWAWSDRS